MLKVYDRWGGEVFQTNDLSQGWNGNNEKGKSCEAGVYFYYLNLRNFKGEVRELKGNVTLIR
jgi:gliding motility-associated-like protein